MVKVIATFWVWLSQSWGRRWDLYSAWEEVLSEKLNFRAREANELFSQKENTSCQNVFPPSIFQKVWTMMKCCCWLWEIQIKIFCMAPASSVHGGVITYPFPLLLHRYYNSPFFHSSLQCKHMWFCVMMHKWHVSQPNKWTVEKYRKYRNGINQKLNVTTKTKLLRCDTHG